MRLHVRTRQRLMIIIIASSIIASLLITSLEVLFVYNTVYQYAHSVPDSLYQSCGTVGPDGSDVDGTIGITNPASVAVDVSWSYEFFFQNFGSPVAYGQMTFHASAHSIAYVFVKFSGLAPYDNIGAIHPDLLDVKSNYHVLLWSFQRDQETKNQTIPIPFHTQLLYQDC